MDILKLHHLHPFDDAGDVINEEDEKAGPASPLISMVLKTSSKNGRTSVVQDPHTRREGAQR